MDFSEDTDLTLIREGVRAVCTKFDDEYWAERDSRHEFPWDFYRALADACAPSANTSLREYLANRSTETIWSFPGA